MWSLRPVRHLRHLRHVNARPYCVFNPVDHSTGVAKRELLARSAGDSDPFHMQSIKKGPGTLNQPNQIPSVNASRLVACSCSPWDNHLEYFVLHQGCPRRCGCGYWFELCSVAPL